jgi:hypothetical protein
MPGGAAVLDSRLLSEMVNLAVREDEKRRGSENSRRASQSIQGWFALSAARTGQQCHPDREEHDF